MTGADEPPSRSASSLSDVVDHPDGCRWPRLIGTVWSRAARGAASNTRSSYSLVRTPPNADSAASRRGTWDHRQVDSPSSDRPALSRPAKAFRTFHALVAVVDLAALVYIWTCAVTGRHGRLLKPAIAALVVEGGALVVGGGDCPLGPLQAKIGDPVPLFELVLPSRAAKAAVPLLAAASVVGTALVLVRALTPEPGPLR